MSEPIRPKSIDSFARLQEQNAKKTESSDEDIYEDHNKMSQHLPFVNLAKFASGTFSFILNLPKNIKNIFHSSVEATPNSNVTKTFPDGTYTGGWDYGQRNGQGVMHYTDGNKYEGKWLDDFQHGQGTMYYANGDKYDGEWEHNKPHGKGTMFYANGNRYKGQWKAGKRNGRGGLLISSGEMVFNNWEEDIKNGPSMFMGSDNIQTFVHYKDNLLINLISNLGDLKFIGLLTGKLGSIYQEYTLGILHEFLKKKYDYSSGFIESALHILTSSKPKTEIAKETLEKLEKQDSPQLLAYGFSGHSMGLNIHQAEEDTHYYLDIFNSGSGLEKYHPEKFVGEKRLYQTMLRVKIPKEQLTQDLLVKLLNFQNFKNADEAYEAILNIYGAQKITPDPFEAVWQREQKSGNCSLEWIFAYLRNIKSLHNYTRMRRKLYEAALEASKASEAELSSERLKHLVYISGIEKPFSTQEAYEHIRAELERKLHKAPDYTQVSPLDRTGAYNARLKAIEQAKKQVESEKLEEKREALSIFRKLVDKGEALEEAAQAAKRLEEDEDQGIRYGALRLKREIEYHSPIEQSPKKSSATTASQR